LTETRAGVTTTYTYDSSGHRASKAAGGTTETYTVDDADKLTNIKVGTTTIKSYGYDAAGRTTSVVSSAGTTTLAYDYEGRISTITYPSSATNSFTYNGLDTRVGKVDSAGTTTYRRDGDDVLSPVLEAGGTKFTPGISRRTGTTSAFYHVDRLGSNTRQTSSAQGSIASRQYDAFGNLAATSGTWTGPFGFAGGYGYQEDTDSGLQLLGHRYYDSSTGRFLTRDPIKDGRNWYGFVGNNPLSFIDPEGLSSVINPLYASAALDAGITGPAAGTGAATGGFGGPMKVIFAIGMALGLLSPDLPVDEVRRDEPSQGKPLYRVVEPPEEESLRQSGCVPTPSPVQGWEVEKNFFISPSDAAVYQGKQFNWNGIPLTIWVWPNPKGVGRPWTHDGLPGWNVKPWELPMVGPGRPL